MSLNVRNSERLPSSATGYEATRLERTPFEATQSIDLDQSKSFEVADRAEVNEESIINLVLRIEY